MSKSDKESRSEIKGVQMSPNDSKRVHKSPCESKCVQVRLTEAKGVQVRSSESKLSPMRSGAQCATGQLIGSNATYGLETKGPQFVHLF